MRPQTPSKPSDSSSFSAVSLLVIFIPALIGIGAILLSLTAGTALAGAESTWDQVSARLRSSTAQVASFDPTGAQDGVCTAFSIHEQKSYWMTAAHCLSASVTVEGHIAWAVFVNEDADLAVLMVPGISLPALQPRVQDIEVGMPVATFGYGHGWPVPQMRIAHVAVVGALMEFLPDTQRVLVVDNVLVGGMSGGPMVDEDGRVVSVNQLTDSGSGSGMGRVMPLVMEITRQFWEFDR